MNDHATNPSTIPPTPGSPADDLGPFAPPTAYPLEEELQSQPPRPIPFLLREGRYARRQRRLGWGFFFAGVICLLCRPLPIVQTWGLYLLPLQYLHWIGLGCLVIAAVGAVRNWRQVGPYRYVVEGMPLVARIRELVLQASTVVNSEPTGYRFNAVIEYKDPFTGDLRMAPTQSDEISSAARDQLTTSFHVGDYVTAVYLPVNADSSLRLYGFLGLRPDLGLIRRDGSSEASLLKLLLGIAAIFGILGVLGWDLYALGRFEPVAWSFAQQGPPFALGALLLGGALLGWLAHIGQRQRRRLLQRNQEAAATRTALELEARPGAGWFGRYGVLIGLMLIAGALLLGGMTSLCWSFTLNALLDRSQPDLQPVQIENLVMVTHNFIFREYKIEYRFLAGDQGKHSLLSTPDHLDQFKSRLALAEVHSGWLGWPWVKTVTPVNAGDLNAKPNP